MGWYGARADGPRLDQHSEDVRAQAERLSAVLRPTGREGASGGNCYLRHHAGKAHPLWQVWHLPGPQTVTTRALLDLVAGQVGHAVGVRSVPKLALRALGLINPIRQVASQLTYQ